MLLQMIHAVDDDASYDDTKAVGNDANDTDDDDAVAVGVAVNVAIAKAIARVSSVS